MQELMFKAKRFDNGEWVRSGSINTFLDNGIKSYYMPQYDEKCVCTHEELTDNILKFEECKFYKVAPSTLCQYTGFDDVNKKGIYRGDIIRTYDTTEDDDYIVDWDDKRGGFVICSIVTGQKYEDLIGDVIADLLATEVIGNIYDNPELLKGGAE